MDDIIVEEAKILSRNYSENRINTKKWKLFIKEEPTRIPIQIIEELGENILLISRNSIIIDAYKSRDLYKRGKIRRNFNLLKAILELWKIVNPFHLPGISEKVYKRFYYIIYSTINKDVYQEETLIDVINKDARVDFDIGQCLGFNDFFDGIFEFIDCNTRSTLSCEYCHVANHLCMIANDITWGSGINLHSKTHINGQSKQIYHKWMQDLLNINIKNKSQLLPKIMKTPTNLPVSNRLITKYELKKIDTDNFNLKKFEKIKSERVFKKSNHDLLKQNSRIKKVKSLDRKAKTFYSNYIDKISPLSSIIKSTRAQQNILENVIDGRKALIGKEETYLK